MMLLNIYERIFYSKKKSSSNELLAVEVPVMACKKKAKKKKFPEMISQAICGNGTDGGGCSRDSRSSPLSLFKVEEINVVE